MMFYEVSQSNQAFGQFEPPEMDLENTDKVIEENKRLNSKNLLENPRSLVLDPELSSSLSLESSDTIYDQSLISCQEMELNLIENASDLYESYFNSPDSSKNIDLKGEDLQDNGYSSTQSKTLGGSSHEVSDNVYSSSESVGCHASQSEADDSINKNPSNETKISIKLPMHKSDVSAKAEDNKEEEIKEKGRPGAKRKRNSKPFKESRKDINRKDCIEKKVTRALKNVTKFMVEEFGKSPTIKRLINSIKKNANRAGEQTKELISCLLDKLNNSFESLTKTQMTQAVAQFIHFLLKKISIDALNSISEKFCQNIRIKDMIKDIEN